MTSTLTRITQKEIGKPFADSFSPNSNLSPLEQTLNMIFEEELNKKDSIFIKVDKNVISKIASFILSSTKKCASIGIAGETASGKSTVAYDIITSIQDFAQEFEIENAITRINTDDYYYDRSEMVKAAGSFAKFTKNYDLDVPQAIELELMKKHIQKLLLGKQVLLPKYDMSGTAIRYDNFTLATPSKIIISEGLFSLTDSIKDAFDFKIYVDVTQKTQAERFFIRAKERDLGENAQNILDNASEKAHIYIRPCKHCADIVLSGEADRSCYKAFINRLIKLIQTIHCNKTAV